MKHPNQATLVRTDASAFGLSIPGTFTYQRHYPQTPSHGHLPIRGSAPPDSLPRGHLPIRGSAPRPPEQFIHN